MNTSTPPHHRSPKLRRLGAALLTLALTASIFGSIVLVNILAERHNLAIDVTARGEQTLSARTNRVINGLEDGWELVLAGPWSGDTAQLLGHPPQAVQGVVDVARRFDEASPRLRVTLLDTTRSADQARFAELLSRLATRDAEAVEQQRRTLAEAIEAIERSGDRLAAIGARLRRAADAFPPSEAEDGPARQFESWASILERDAESLRTASANAAEALTEQLGIPGVPGIDRARDSVRSVLQAVESQLPRFRRVFEQAAGAGVPGAASSELRAAAGDTARLRDDLARRLDQVERLRVPDTVRIARLLLSQDAAIIAGPPGRGVTAISFDALFPPPERGRDADLRRRAEEAFNAGLLSLAGGDAPIVVFINPNPQSLLETGVMRTLRQRMELRRISFVEWNPADDPSPPSLLSIDPQRRRPVVFVSIGTDPGGRFASGPDGPTRNRALGEAVARVLEQGDALLVCASPFDAPAAIGGRGLRDEATEPLKALGLHIRSDSPVLVERVVSGDLMVEASVRPSVDRREDPSLAAEPHTVAQALAGLPVTLRFASPIDLTDENDNAITRTPLLTLRGAGRQRDDWVRFFRHRDADDPSARFDAWVDSDRTEPGRAGGPWTFAAAVSRPFDNRPGRQRVIAVGANGWFFDNATLATEIVDGRRIAANPGNAELFEASIYWLAGLDELIAPGPGSLPTPRITRLEESESRALGWAMIGGLPLLILFLGAMWRLVRG